jgi:glucosylceramidase
VRQKFRIVAIVLALAVAPAAAVIASQASPQRLAALAPVKVQIWETTGDGSKLLAQQHPGQFVPSRADVAGSIVVDDRRRYQPMLGFGASITDSSAYVLLHDMSAAQRSSVMSALFDPVHGIGLDYLRQPIGSNDFATGTYTEDDAPGGRTDITLAHFSIAHDMQSIIPVLRGALKLNPRIQILATPWTAPAWMKTNQSLIGGTLDPRYLTVYAQYLVKFVQAYARYGVPIAALTMANEPDYSPVSYPGMLLSSDAEAALVPLLARDLAAAHLRTEIIGGDSNWADYAYSLRLLDTPGARRYLAGTAFHCYAGDPSGQGLVQAAFPDKQILETECTGYASAPGFAANLVNGTRMLVIDGVRNWSRTVLFWNMVLDQNSGPTNGGCLDCIPNVTVNSATGAAEYNVEYYVLGQISRFVVPGARRVASTSPVGNLSTVAFLNPDGGRVLLVLNAGSTPVRFTARWDGRSLRYSLPGSSVATFTWR